MCCGHHGMATMQSIEDCPGEEIWTTRFVGKGQLWGSLSDVLNTELTVTIKLNKTSHNVLPILTLRISCNVANNLHDFWHVYIKGYWIIAIICFCTINWCYCLQILLFIFIKSTEAQGKRVYKPACSWVYKYPCWKYCKLLGNSSSGCNRNYSWPPEGILIILICIQTNLRPRCLSITVLEKILANELSAIIGG